MVVDIWSAAEKGHAQLVKKLLERGQDPNAASCDGSTPLHKAAYSGCVEALLLLLKAGAGINATNDKGTTPLHVLAGHGRHLLVELLISEGAAVHAVDNGGNTALHLAAKYGQGHEVAELLLSKGADPTARNHDGKTPFDLALAGGHQKLAERLRGLTVSALLVVCPPDATAGWKVSAPPGLALPDAPAGTSQTGAASEGPGTLGPPCDFPTSEIVPLAEVTTLVKGMPVIPSEEVLVLQDGDLRPVQASSPSAPCTQPTRKKGLVNKKVEKIQPQGPEVEIPTELEVVEDSPKKPFSRISLQEADERLWKATETLRKRYAQGKTSLQPGGGSSACYLISALNLTPLMPQAPSTQPSRKKGLANKKVEKIQPHGPEVEIPTELEAPKSPSAQRSDDEALPTSTASPTTPEPSAVAPAAVRPAPPEPPASAREDRTAPQWQPGLGVAAAFRALNDFDGSSYGTEYLSLVKGEQLLVQPEPQEGWLFALSRQTRRTGWIPPTFVEAVVRQPPTVRPKPPPPPPPSLR